jgi:hypothetical protein
LARQLRGGARRDAWALSQTSVAGGSDCSCADAASEAKEELIVMSSCPRLSRASTPSFNSKDVDGRNKSGHDKKRQNLFIVLAVRLPSLVK